MAQTLSEAIRERSRIDRENEALDNLARETAFREECAKYPGLGLSRFAFTSGWNRACEELQKTRDTP